MKILTEFQRFLEIMYPTIYAPKFLSIDVTEKIPIIIKKLCCVYVSVHIFTSPYLALFNILYNIPEENF